jgi:hypothetical protein
MAETMGKRLRQQPIKCWGHNGDHMYRECPLKVEKTKVIHNVQQIEIVEHMGKNIPVIYAALNNKQVEYQSHMIEVKGKIHNQLIAILIDSGASHSCNDP